MFWGIQSLAEDILSNVTPVWTCAERHLFQPETNYVYMINRPEYVPIELIMKGLQHPSALIEN